jgi:hypothetical protein
MMASDATRIGSLVDVRIDVYTKFDAFHDCISVIWNGILIIIPNVS